MSHCTRRGWIKMLAAGAALAPAWLRGQSTQPDRRLRLAFVGVGGQGANLVRSLSGHEMVAFADVDDARAAKIYAEFPEVPRYRDYRQMLDRHAAGIDACVIATPDHTHHPIASAVLQLSKHVYLEKPLCPTIAECRSLAALAARSRVRTQMGVHGHSFEALRVLREWIQAGAVGPVQSVQLWSDRLPPTGTISSQQDAAAEEIPATLDWKLWLGNRRERPYSSRYLPSRWRNWWDFGTGAIGDIGVHMFDALTFALDLGSPSVVEGVASDHSDFTAPRWSRIRWVFPSVHGRQPIEVKWVAGWEENAPLKPDVVPHLPAELIANTPNAMALTGLDGTLFIPDMRASVRPRIFPLKREAEFLAIPPPRTLPRPKGGHYQDWIDAILDERPASAPFSYGAELTERVLLGALALRSGAPIRWRPQEMRAEDNAAANVLISPALRRL